MELLNLNENFELIKVDLLRRSHQYERLIEEYSTKTFSDSLLNQICTFHIIKSKLEDDNCYTLEDVIKEND